MDQSDYLLYHQATVRDRPLRELVIESRPMDHVGLAIDSGEEWRTHQADADLGQIRAS